MKVKTAYSFNHAIGDLDKTAGRLLECKFPAFPISDRLSTFGFRRWNEKCKGYDKKPVFGVEIPITEKFGEEKAPLDYWTFFAIDELEPLNDLITIATSCPHKTPRLLYHQIEEIENLFIVTGSNFPIDDLKHLAKKPNLFFGLSPATPKLAFAQAKKQKFKFIATSENVYPVKEDRELYRMALGRRAFTQSYPQHILNRQEWKDSLYFVPESTKTKALSNQTKVLKACNAELKQAEIFKPKPKKTLKKHCTDGAKTLGVDLSDPIYKERLRYELKLIKEKGYEDYFHIIIDLVSWSKKEMIVGPARGSSCGSLVCYLTGITTVDPIKYDLIFERFIDINRDDLPDIDIDFSERNRHLAFEYLEKSHGREKVARLGTVNNFQPRSALKAIGAALNAPPWEVDKALDGLIEHHAGDSAAQSQLFETLHETINGQALLKDYPEIEAACDLEGQPRHAGQHAAGVVLTNGNVNEIVAIDASTGATFCDKKDAEALNLLKIDCLGLKQLSIFERCLELIGENPINGFLESLPLDDQAAFDVLNSKKYFGVFQFQGQALQGLANEIEFTDLEDLVSITALARPGPLNAGAAHSWVRRKKGKEFETPLHPLVEPYTKNTLGVIAYQEQVMKIVREIGGLSWKDVTLVRKGMGKTLGEEYLNQYRDKFLKGAVKSGMKKDEAESIWSKMLTFGAYAFNRSHAVAYGLVSYWCCYLKAHFPLEFAAATLDSQSDPMKQIGILKELQKEGISYKAFDLEKSVERWTIDKKRNILIGPLTNIKGIGQATQAEIIDSRETGEPLRENLLKRLETAKTEIDTLTPIQTALNTIAPDLSAIGIASVPVDIEKIQPKQIPFAMAIGVIKSVKKKDENSPEMVKKRGYKFTGPDQALNIWLQDDTGEIFCKINRFDFQKMGVNMLKTARPGKSIYAIKGEVPAGFRMISIDRIKYIGELDGSENKVESKD